MTEMQIALLNDYLVSLPDEKSGIYRETADCLLELGYSPRREGANISFKCKAHGKQLAKMGVKKGKRPYPFFALRFSACRGLSERFTGIIKTNIEKYPKRAALCAVNKCGYCGGQPITHVYSHTFPDGESRFHCGAYVLEIPDITVNELEEIKGLIREENDYLLKNELREENLS